MTVTGRSLKRAKAVRRRMLVFAAVGWGLFVAGAVAMLAVGGVSEGLARTLVVVGFSAAVLVAAAGLVGVTYATHDIRSVDVEVPADPPLPPAGPAAEVPATARWLDGRSQRIRRWLIGWALALAGLVVVFAFAGGPDRLAGFHTAEAVGVLLVLSWLTCTVAVLVNVAARSVFRRRLAQPWREVSCEVVARPPDAAGKLGNPRAVIRLADGSAHSVRLRRLVVWTRWPIPDDGRAHRAWWAGADGDTGCLATPGGAPVICAEP